MLGRWRPRTRPLLWSIGLFLIACMAVGMTLQGAAQARKEAIEKGCGPFERVDFSETSQNELVQDSTTNLQGSSLAEEEVKKEPEPPITIGINLGERRLTIYSKGEPFKSYPVGVGRFGDPSPIGEWMVVHKDRGWGGGFGTRWMGLNVPWGIYGIHGTNNPGSIGGYVSAGCIRMQNRDVEELFPWVPLKTPVRIYGQERDVVFRKVLRPEQSGQDIVFVQLALREAGFDAGPADGRFGPATVSAVKSFRQEMGLPPGDDVDEDVLFLLGLGGGAKR